MRGLRFAGRILLKIQKKIGINRLKYDGDYYKKGYANWSITDALARFFVEHSETIMRECRLSYLADEVCFHTLVYHSSFHSNIYDFEDEYHSAMRITSWTDPHNQLHYDDVPMLIDSNRLFARKFDDDRAIETINEIIRLRK